MKTRAKGSALVTLSSFNYLVAMVMTGLVYHFIDFLHYSVLSLAARIIGCSIDDL